MDRRKFIKTTATAAAGTALTNSVFAQQNSSNGKQPNILFLITDQQHSGMMSCTGNPWLNTPALDKLAAEGIRFGKAYAANPVCVPSRMGMATGMMPARLGALDNGSGTKVRNLPKEALNNSMGKLMKRAGYDTFYGGKVHMASGLVPSKETGYDQYFSNQRELLPGACVDFIKKNRANPFFAVASFINPHDICFAYNAYKKREKMMEGVNELYEQASAIPLEELPPLPANFEIPKNEPDAIAANGKTTAVTPSGTMRTEYNEREWRMYRWIYCRLTEKVDGHIGQILDGLKESGQEENTVVIFVSDHGDMDASHGLASKGLFYDESVCVPMVMRYSPTIQAGQVNNHLVNTGLDILPTFCDYAGVKTPDHLLGKSVRSIAENKPVPNWRDFVASENHWTRMIRSERYKYCAYKEGKQRESLVDMQSDPGEMQNLAGEKRFEKELIKHRRLLKDWVKVSADKHGENYLLST
ncbi:MAG: sulfatase-like hydrolase/transferase [Verrucomicrobia bacterium]|nr:sulfatase-like hydrolase/transferase [Verrucomicrobiota bacterium]